MSEAEVRPQVADGNFDEELAMRALEQADPNILRLSLMHATGDDSLADMRIERVESGLFPTWALGEEHHAEVKERMLEFLRSAGTPAVADSDRVRMLMSMANGAELTDEAFRFGFEELALEDFPRDVRWTSEPSAALLENLHVTIIGGGFSGIAVAVQLGRLGIPYTLVERQAGLGGTWMFNDYPGLRVDVPSSSYQFKFEKKYPWKSIFPRRAEILEYLEHVAAKHDVLSHCKFETEVEDAVWKEADSVWELTVADASGSHETLRTNYVVCAAGLFSTPLEAGFEGIDEFRGRVMHSTTWDNDYDYRGKKVAIIGSGSSGAQLAPTIVADVASLALFARTPHWVMPVPGYLDEWAAEIQWLFDNVPYYWNWFSYTSFLAVLNFQDLQEDDTAWQAAGGAINEANDKLRAMLLEYIQSHVGDRPDLIDRVVPSVAPLGRRFVVDMGWYDTIKRDDVELVSDRIARFDVDGIVTEDGRDRAFDLVVLATGFQVSKYFFPVKYVGRDGATLDQLWERDGARAYLSMTFPGLPNFFAMYGPNGQSRTGGFPMSTEIWTRYILEAIIGVTESGHSSLEVRRDVYDAYNESVDAANKTVIWEREGKGSYYINKFGRNELNHPFRVQDAFLSMESVDLGDYHVK
jgi:4-hydroxyacetophenone monooxygenase